MNGACDWKGARYLLFVGLSKCRETVTIHCHEAAAQREEAFLSAPNDPHEESPSRHLLSFRDAPVAWLTLAISLAATAVSWQISESHVQQVAQARFDRRVEEARISILDRVL